MCVEHLSPLINDSIGDEGGPVINPLSATHLYTPLMRAASTPLDCPGMQEWLLRDGYRTAAAPPVPPADRSRQGFRLFIKIKREGEG